MDQVPTQTLAQYGAIGAAFVIVLGLVVLVFKQLITHILKQNERQQEKQEENQAKTLESLHAIGQAIRDMTASTTAQFNRFEIDMRKDVAELVHSEVTQAGSRAHRTRPRDG